MIKCDKHCIERDQSTSRAWGSEAKEGPGADQHPAWDVWGES